MSFDFDKVGVLVHILEGVAKVAPQNSYIVAWAHRELKEINDQLGEEAKKIADEKAKKDAEEAAHASAVAAAEVQKQADADEIAQKKAEAARASEARKGAESPKPVEPPKPVATNPTDHDDNNGKRF